MISFACFPLFCHRSEYFLLSLGSSFLEGERPIPLMVHLVGTGGVRLKSYPIPRTDRLGMATISESLCPSHRLRENTAQRLHRVAPNLVLEVTGHSQALELRGWRQGPSSEGQPLPDREDGVRGFKGFGRSVSDRHPAGASKVILSG